MNDQIKLVAEAMGWKLWRKTNKDGVIIVHTRSKDMPYEGRSAGYVWNELPWYTVPNAPFSPNFDPFTDANDDYAVLEHYRNLDKDSIEYARFKDALFYGGTSMPRGKYTYKIGDYARAALTVIK